MGTAKERHSMTESYLAEIKSKMGNSSLLEENDMKMLHMNAALGDWKEWRTVTYDHNVLADWLVRENEDLHRIKKDLEMKIRELSAPNFPYSPGLSQSLPTVAESALDGLGTSPQVRTSGGK